MQQKIASLSVKTAWILSAVMTLTACTLSGESSDTIQNIGKPSPIKSPVPTITLNGSSNIQIAAGNNFEDPGATAYDDQDGDLTGFINTKSEVNTAVPGHYNIDYSVTDSNKNTVSVSRTVTVAKKGDNYYVDWIKDFSLPAQDSNGWSVLTPSKDSKIMYVSNDGNDETAKVYTPDDSTVGNDVFNPTGAIKPYASIEAALDQLRPGSPDYVLLKRGDTWESPEVNIKVHGRSVQEKAVLSAYGDLADNRPLIKNSGAILNKSGYLAIVGIHFQASKRNPSSSDFVGFDKVDDTKGINAALFNDYGGLLIEDCWFEWFDNNSIQSFTFDKNNNFLTIKDIIVRRNIFNNNYSTAAHSQGLYSAYTSMLLEENVFDHNGWYQQGDGSTKKDGKATMFNHNTYFPEAQGSVFRNNIFLRASSMGNKFTSNSEDSEGSNSIKAWNILVDNNFYAEGEIGISLGGNKDQDDGPRWENIIVVNNVLTAIGRTFPTNRTLGWGIGISDWKNGLVQNNLMFNWGQDDNKSGDYKNVYAIDSKGHVTNTIINYNIAYGLVTGTAVISFSDQGEKEFVAQASNHITFTNNQITLLKDSGGRIMAYDIQPKAQNFANNDYHFDTNDAYWFRATDKYIWSELKSNRDIDFAGYQSISEDNTSIQNRQSYPAPNRTISDYLKDKNIDSTANATTEMNILVNLLKTQRRGNWDQKLTAGAINNYFREGFSR
ncbi:DUF5011 domain-containing protein [Gynuella sunshinyii]|uniref:Pesticidal crystal protein Cry22Aa Ig-like domain-containing protein n=1 Tax=Gynuella sunshinyii YC6258 TaxID=1445510 RepID=A0A0C5UYV2_9GAMM|nr:DUF5011 domain-containing protein [Gynuella sunshinyii]AJQ92505.1 hypothetical Protein YC6258_00455 [Gynuella sunshinyii YC6258]